MRNFGNTPIFFVCFQRLLPKTLSMISQLFFSDCVMTCFLFTTPLHTYINQKILFKTILTNLGHLLIRTLVIIVAQCYSFSIMHNQGRSPLGNPHLKATYDIV